MFDNNNSNNNWNYSGHKVQKLLFIFFLCLRVPKCDFVCFNVFAKAEKCLKKFMQKQIIIFYRFVFSAEFRMS